MKYILAIALCLSAINVVAGSKALTDDGDVVILNDDGTWVYENSDSDEVTTIELNPNKFIKPHGSNFMLKSKKTNAAFWVDTKKWTVNKGDGAIEYNLEAKAGDLYGMVISEEIEIKPEELVKIAFENAKSAAPDMRVIIKEYRVVNGKKVIYMEMEGTVQSIQFKYFGYYYSDSAGTTQYLTYTGSSLVKKYKTEIDNFLNGLVSQS